MQVDQDEVTKILDRMKSVQKIGSQAGKQFQKQENEYGRLFQQLVKMGVRQQIKKKYR